MGVTELTKNAANVLPEGGLDAKLKLGRPLRVKLGIDVTAPVVTLGNGIPLQRMAAFQREGHTGVLIVGDYTTRIGDPSGRVRLDESLDVSRSQRLPVALAGHDDARIIEAHGQPFPCLNKGSV